MTRLQLEEKDCHPYYMRYITKVPAEAELRETFKVGKLNVMQFFEQIPEDKWTYRYGSDKWSIAEVLQHLIDTERIFMYRCFRLARKDSTAMAGFNQNWYMDPSEASSKARESLIKEYEAQRDSSISLLHSLNNNHLTFVGTADGVALSARAAAFTVLGHEIWHMETIKNNYL